MANIAIAETILFWQCFILRTTQSPALAGKEGFMAVIQREVRKRGFVGKLVKWAFILFNLGMAAWLVAYWGEIGGMMKTGSEAGDAGAAVGATIGTGVLVFFWLAGAVVLGIFTLLTRGPRRLITEEK